MLKKIVFLFLFAASVSALADSWDSNGNINKATDRAVNIYRKKGIDGLVAEAKNCYASLDTHRANKTVGRDVEYCIAFEVTSSLIEQKRTEGNAVARSPYLNTNEIFVRGIYYLEIARIITLPEQVSPYFNRFTNIQHKLPAQM